MPHQAHIEAHAGEKGGGEREGPLQGVEMEGSLQLSGGHLARRVAAVRKHLIGGRMEGAQMPEISLQASICKVAGRKVCKIQK